MTSENITQCHVAEVLNDDIDNVWKCDNGEIFMQDDVYENVLYLRIPQSKNSPLM